MRQTGPHIPIFNPERKRGLILPGTQQSGTYTPPVPVPSSLVMVESFHVSVTLNNAWGIAMSGSVACVTANNRLVTIDASDPTNLSLISSIQRPTGLSGVRDVAIYAPGNVYAVCAAFGGGRVTLINVTNPSSLSETASLSIASSQPDSVAIKGNYAIVTDQSNEAIHSVDLTTPGTPTLADTLTHSSIKDPAGIAVVGNVAAVIMEDGAAVQTRVVFIDVTDPTNMSILGSVLDAELEGGAQVAATGSTAVAVAYGISGPGSIHSINFASPSSPTIQDQIVGGSVSSPEGVGLYQHATGLWAVVADAGNDMLHLLDCRDTSALAIVHSVTPTANTWRTNPVITGDHVIAISASGDAVRVAEIVSTV